jgi:hypothetical protein
MDEKILRVSEIREKYNYAEGYLCHKILMDELEMLDDNYEMRDPINRMISEKKVFSNFSWSANRVFLTYKDTGTYRKEDFLIAVKEKFKDTLLTYFIVEESYRKKTKKTGKHIHIFLTFNKKQRKNTREYFTLFFINKNCEKERLIRKEAWVESVYNDDAVVIYYLKKDDNFPLTNMLLENGRLLKLKNEKIDYLCRKKKKDEIWEYINNDLTFKDDIIHNATELYKEITKTITYYQPSLDLELQRECFELLKKDKVLYNWIEKPEKTLGKKC